MSYLLSYFLKPTGCYTNRFKTTVRISISIFIFFAVIGVASATTYYVRTDGNDANNGLSNTPTDAWKTIQKGTATIVAGDTLYVQGPGTYTGTVTLTTSGTSTAQISIIGINNPTLSGTGNGFYIQNQEYYTIQGFNITGYNYPIYISADSNSPKSGIKILTNNIYNSVGGITLQGTTGLATDVFYRNLTIEGNDLHDLTMSNFNAPIDFPSYGYNTGLIIRNNNIHDIPNGNGINYGTDGGLIDNNTLTNIGYNGITTFKSRNQIISNNTFNNIPNRQGGIRTDYGAGTGMIIRGNKFLYTAGIQLYPDSNNITIENNIFQGGKEIQVEGGSGHKILNNTFGAGNARLELIGVSPVISNMIIKGNTFDTSMGLRLGGGIYDTTITENLFINNPGSGILKSTVTTGTQSNITIKNNVFYNNGADDISFTGGTVNLVTIKNNIFMNGAGYAVYRSVGTNFAASYNDVYGNSNTYSSGVTTSNNIAQDPLFANPASSDFHLKSQYGRYTPTGWVIDSQTSPAIDAGDPTSQYSLEPAPNGNRINLGNYGNTQEASKSTGAVPPFDFSVSNSGAITVSQGASNSNTITASLTSGTTQPVTFSTSGLPSGATSSFSGGGSCNPTCSKTLTISTLTSTPTGTYSIITSGTNGTITRTTSFSLIINILDTTPPATIMNLATSNPTSNSITLSWTAPGDDGNNGTATSYDIRYSTSPITDANWASATQATGEPTPLAAGTSQSFTVTGLLPATTYYFAIKTSDEVPNLSGLSNIPQGTTGAASANIFYVRTDGNDNCNGQYNNGGTSGNCAWRTVQKAASTLTAGQTARVQSGTYSEAVTISNSGNAISRINLIGDNNPILDYPSGTGITMAGKSYINISGFTIRNYANYGVLVDSASNHIDLNSLVVYNSGSQGILMTNGVSNITVSNSIVHNNGWNEIQVYGDPDYTTGINQYITISNNEVYNCGHSCIDIHTMANHITILNNIVHRDSGVGNGGIYVHNGYVAGRYHNYISVINNTVYNNYWSVLMEQSNNSIVQNNILYSNSRGIDADANFNTSINHNIVYNSGVEGVSLWDSLGTSFNNTIESNTINGITGNGILVNENRYNIIKNNIIVSNTQYGIKAGALTATSYNNVWGNAAGNYNGGVSAGTGSISVDPLFANPASGDFRLKSQYGRYTLTGWVTDSVTSPAIDAGDPTSAYSLEPAPNGNRINMGAYGNTPEASKSSGTIPPFDFSVSNSGSITAEQGSFGSNTITASLVSGSTQAVTFSISGLPPGATSSFSSNSCNPTCSTTMTISASASTTTGTYPVIVSATNGTLTKTTSFNLIVTSPSPYTILTLSPAMDTSIKSGEPDTTRDTKTWIDLGRLAGSTYGNYHGLIYFDLSSIPSNAQINNAILTLAYEGDNRNQTTKIGVFRPSAWDNSATWNSKQTGVSWTTSGGDWTDKNGISYGATPYSEVTYPLGSTQDANFDVKALVQQYASGAQNTGFFLKANEIENSYISFYSSEWTNPDQRPRLVINYTTSGAPSNPAPSITAFAPINLTPSVSLNSSAQFIVSADQQVSNTWYLNGVNQNNNVQTWSYIWNTPGQYNVTYAGSNSNGSVSLTWNVSVIQNSLPYDVNQDGSVDIADLVIVSQHFGETTASPYPRYDVNADGKVDILDLTSVSTKISTSV
jgi:hypothetical protein